MSEVKDIITSLRIKGSTRTRLEDVTRKSETYDDVINKLIDVYLVSNKRGKGNK
jgi:hypothetical protein